MENFCTLGLAATHLPAEGTCSYYSSSVWSSLVRIVLGAIGGDGGRVSSYCGSPWRGMEGAWPTCNGMFSLILLLDGYDGVGLAYFNMVLDNGSFWLHGGFVWALLDSTWGTSGGFVVRWFL
ncbi:hypothetical protein GOP47_0005521 [Adiantum capillus-veneris]|uniref:Uncharacterized protein n=1 Tax=Adiantum capillus-veneris TaxID=13818 RepID=A0A9D4V5Y9_ADICA|nr:hypothetical protein GOP47_0005521 [Adiantum capillus-veneris]